MSDSQQFAAPVPADQPTLPPKAPKNGKKPPSWAVTLGVLGIGVAIGAVATAPVTPVTPAPETVTETVTETVEVEKIVEVTPQACLDALQLASDGFLIAAEFIDYIMPAAEAGMNYDVAGIEKISSDMAASNEKLSVLQPKASAASAECRSKSGS